MVGPEKGIVLSNHECNKPSTVYEFAAEGRRRGRKRNEYLPAFSSPVIRSRSEPVISSSYISKGLRLTMAVVFPLSLPSSSSSSISGSSFLAGFFSSLLLNPPLIPLFSDKLST
jgi:hypothetical protein